MTFEGWHEARLIPATGITSQREQEHRAISVLLATMTTVEQFGRALLAPLGAPSGTIEAFVEAPRPGGKAGSRPHGVIQTGAGETDWKALVEVSTGPRTLHSSRLEACLDLAARQGIDALLTISNEVPPVAGQHPTSVAKEKLGQVAMIHCPWSRIVAEAVVAREAIGHENLIAARVLGELIHYLEHPRSGALLFEVADDTPTVHLPRLATPSSKPIPSPKNTSPSKLEKKSMPSPVAEVPAPRGPARREIRIALRDDTRPDTPDQPGWYRDKPGQDDPAGERLRWWDGSIWTDHVYPLPPAPAEAENAG